MFTTTKRLLALVTAGAVSLTLAACSPSTSDSGEGEAADSPTEVTLVTHNDFALPDELKADFEKTSGLKLNLVQASSGAELVNKLKLSKDTPIGDAVYGLATNDMALVAQSEILADSGVQLPAGVDKFTNAATPAAIPVDHGDICLNYDVNYFKDAGLAEPKTFDDLVKPEYKDMLVTIDPNKVTGFAFLASTIAKYGEDGWQQYWKDLKANGMKVAPGWSEAYEQEFSAGGGEGKYPIVVSYASSPAFTVNEEGTAASTAAMMETCFGQVEYAGVLQNAGNPEGAKQVIEWLLSPEVQAAIPDNMYMYPVLDSVELPAAYKFAPAPDTSLSLPAEQMLEKQQDWVADWLEIVG